MSGLTQTEADELQEIVQLVADIIAPAIGPRDYRKEAWIMGYQIAQFASNRSTYADGVLAEFDKRFPK